MDWCDLREDNNNKININREILFKLKYSIYTL